MRAVNLLPRDHGQRTIKKESLPVLVGGCSGSWSQPSLGAMFMMGSGKIAAAAAQGRRPQPPATRRCRRRRPGRQPRQQQLAGEQSARVSALEHRAVEPRRPGTASSASSRSSCPTTSG